jgi:uncharacterized membrane protein
MITHPLLLIFIFVGIVSLVYGLSENPKTSGIFRYLPAPLWCYFVPTFLASVGWVPSQTPLYALMSRFILPASLILMLLATDIPALLKLSRKALLAMVAGSFGIGVGAFLTFILAFKMAQFGVSGLQTDLWKGWGCLTGSWTGGSANMIAVKEILQTSETLFSSLIVIDTMIAYAWMAFLIFLSQSQNKIDDKLKIFKTSVPSSFVGELQGERLDTRTVSPTVGFFPRLAQVIFLAIFGFLMGGLCGRMSPYFPSFGSVLNAYTWTILFATTLPLFLSFTPIKKLENFGASKVGRFLLFLLLTSVGVRANFSGLIAAPIFLILGFFWVVIHGGILFLAGWFFKIPVALLATASQANIGGPISTPIVASFYQKDLAPVGVLLAILGNLYGVYWGLFLSQICNWMMNLL